MDLEMKKRSGFGFISGLLAGVIMTSLVVVLGYGIGQFMTEEEGSGTNTGNANVVMVQQDGIVSSEFLQKIDVIETLIDENFYLEEVSAEILREGAYDGIVAALDDIYSVYYTPEEAEEVFQQSEGIYYGIGAYVQMDTVTGYAKITGTIKDTPAEEAGLQAGDILYKVNGEDMAGLDVSQVVLHIKGEEGTSVSVAVLPG